jgi:endonuclease III
MNYDDFIDLINQEIDKVQSFIDTFNFSTEKEREIKGKCEDIVGYLNDVKDEIEKVSKFFNSW